MEKKCKNLKESKHQHAKDQAGTVGTWAPKLEDLRVKNIPSALVNPGLCLIMQMAGQESVQNVDKFLPGVNSSH